MASKFVLLPAAPVLVPELSGAAWADVSTLVDAGVRILRNAVAGSTRGVIVVAQGPGTHEIEYGNHDLRRWGAPTVAVGPSGPDQQLDGPSPIPGAVLMAWWWIARAGLDMDVKTITVSGTAGEHANSVRSVQRTIDAHDGVVVFMADGPAALAPKAPIPLDESAVELDRELSAFVEGASRLPELGETAASSIGWFSQPIWTLLSGYVEGFSPRAASHSAPFGVGYHAAGWTIPSAKQNAALHTTGAKGATSDEHAPRPVVIVGPTGTGKSDLALNLAEELGGQIVNLDAMQLYKGMDIGTAKVPQADRRGIPHHMLDVLDVTETASVADYQREARDVVERVRSGAQTPIVVGGSMMYYQSLIDEWNFPETDPVVRGRYESRLDEIGVQALHAELAEKDPEAAKTILDTDPRRTVRALEVIELTGKPFAASRPKIGKPRWDAEIIALDMATGELDARLEQRTRKMFDQGLIEEVRYLARNGLRNGVTAQRAIGYSQVLELLDEFENSEPTAGAIEEALHRTFIGTRRYVRRQRSWFRRDTRIRWLDANRDATELLVDQALRTVRKPS